MSTLSFLETADVALAPDAVMAQLTGGAAASLGGGWQRLPDDRGVVVRTVRRSPKDSSRTTTVATWVTLEPVPGGTRLRMEVQMELTGLLGWGLRMARPFARPRVRAGFRALLVALTTGDSGELREQTVRTRRAALRVRAATLCIQLFFAGLLTAFVALVSWVDAVVVAAGFMVAAVFPIRRLLRARRALMAASAVGHATDRECPGASSSLDSQTLSSAPTGRAASLPASVGRGDASGDCGMSSEPRYVARFFFDAGSGHCLWPGNDITQELFGLPIEVDRLPLADETGRELQRMLTWYDTCIDWDDPGGPCPWGVDEAGRFKEGARALLVLLRRDLGPAWEVRDLSRP